ncbi:MAG TPA: hypothetical protein VHY20_04890, partial [Pirellulales bacterium]|nr:hypothetical protein [Pirellulales bacterium]
MQIYGQEIPEPFDKAILQGRAKDVADHVAAAPAALFARGLARISLGRFADARRDFETARHEDQAVADACDLELAFLDIRERVN